MLLANDTAEVRIDLKNGGRLSSLRIDGAEILVTTAERSTDWGSYPMAPWAGRVREGRFEWSGTLQKLPLNAPPHALHGTVFDAEWSQLSANTLRAKLGANWPWAGEVQSTFELTEQALEWRLEVHAERAAFPVVLGWHPWFRRQIGGGGDLRLLFDAEEMYVRDESGIPTGALCAPNAGPWDDCFRGVRQAPLLSWPDRLQIRLQSSCDHWVVYSQPSHAVCVEPQSAPPDAFNAGGFEVAEPGRPVVHSFRMEWESL